MSRSLAWPPALPGLELASLPPPDRECAPHTGFGREHWEALADALLAGVWRFASPRGALLLPPGGRASMHGTQSDGLEGYARSFLLAAFRLGGAVGKAPGDLVDHYASGLVAGSEPGHAESWPSVSATAQPMVEAAAVALALFETRPWIWEALPDGAQQRLVDWLTGGLEGRPWPSNWLLFQVVVNGFLAAVGAPHRPEQVARNLDWIDAMYRRDGWYSDGPGQSYDHYVGWALHLYTLWWIRMGGDADDPPRAARYRERARRFLADAIRLFAADGAPLHQGRSLIYRFAAVAPFFAGALLDASPLAPGLTRRVASGALRHFLERGAVADGVLTMGWYEAFPRMAQRYSGPGSPYWASKGFAGLLLGPEHPVWTAREEPLPVEQGDFVRALAEPGWLVIGTHADGIVRIANHKSDHHPAIPWLDEGETAFPDDPFYRKLGYSTHTAPCLGAQAAALDADAQVALLGPDGGASRRARIHAIAAVDRFAASWFHPGETHVASGRAFPIWLERVETVSIARGRAELRIHHAATFSERRLRDGGFAVAGSTAPAVATGPGWCTVRRDDGLCAAVLGLHGFGEADALAFGEANAFGPRAVAPFLVSAEPVGAERVFVALHWLSAAPLDLEAERAAVERVRVEGRLVEIAFTDGEALLVQLVAPEALDRELAGVHLHGAVRFARVSPDGTRFVLREGGASA